MKAPAILFCPFQFGRADIAQLKMALNIPMFITVVPRGAKLLEMVVILIMLQRLSFPSRLCVILSLFGRAEAELSTTFNEVSLSVHVHEYTVCECVFLCDCVHVHRYGHFMCVFVCCIQCR